MRFRKLQLRQGGSSLAGLGGKEGGEVEELCFLEGDILSGDRGRGGIEKGEGGVGV